MGLLERLPFDCALEGYESQADSLKEMLKEGDEEALSLVHQNDPRFLDESTPWLTGPFSAQQIRDATFTIDDARLAVARWYDFLGWEALTAHAAAMQHQHSQAYRFERAVEATVDGDLATLLGLLRDDPELVRERSARVTKFDPAIHRATLLHYVAANGVEGYRQRTPNNAVEIARTLLVAGADPNSLADLYGGECTTMALLVSSSHPAQAGLQVRLIDLLVEFGASVEPLGSGKWQSPLMTALAFGYRDAAEALVRHGANDRSLPVAAALGREEDAFRLLPESDAKTIHRALALAAQHGEAQLVALILDAGADPNRYNPDGLHAHSTPLHQAVIAGHLRVVRLLVERGASLTIRDTIYRSTPLGWALHAGQIEIADFLRSRGAEE